MMIMEKSVPPRKSGRNAKRKSGGIARAFWLSSIFKGMGNPISMKIRVCPKFSRQSFLLNKNRNQWECYLIDRVASCSFTFELFYSSEGISR